MSQAKELDIVGSLPKSLKNPSFAGKGSLWLKNNTHPSIKKSEIKGMRY
jgi:hypothetical protein